ncbi:helix-turn-helix transcriptional regulator [Mucilaginibacter sp. dw_454]|uniref:helix-turn-helix transcriptional regulator n=1 Tax=Mucilaginibacter sp. dw_454 TaxID=2720079 RepID=UPI0031FE685A
MPVITFSPRRKTLKKPFLAIPPADPQTLGDHLRKKRIESGMLQREVAMVIGVSEDTVTSWENNRANPQGRHHPKIFAFLGYLPEGK